MSGAFLGLVAMAAALVPLASQAGRGDRPDDPWRDPANCPTIEHDAPGGCLADYPFESQEGTYACYGFTATKLYDCFLASKGQRKSGVHSSAIEATLDAVDASPVQSNFKSGLTCDVVEHLLANGSCPDEVADRALDRKEHYGDLIDRLLDLRLDYRGILENQSELGEQVTERDERKKRRIEARAQCLLEKRVGDPQLFHDLEPIVAFLSDAVPDRAINGLLFGRTCKAPPRMRAPSGTRALCARVTPFRESDDPADPGHLQLQQFHDLVAELSQGRAVGMSMCAEALLGKGYGVSWNKNPPSGISTKCSSHATTVIGSRFHRGRCQLKVFDSTGILDGGKAWLDAEHLVENTWGLAMISEYDLGK